MGREAALLLVRDLGQDVPHEVDLAALPRGAEPLLPHRGLDPGVGVGDAQRGPFHASRLELPEEDPPRVLRLVEHGLDSQDLSRTGRINTAGDHHGYRDDPSFNTDLLIQGVDPNIKGHSYRLKDHGFGKSPYPQQGGEDPADTSM